MHEHLRLQEQKTVFQMWSHELTPPDLSEVICSAVFSYSGSRVVGGVEGVNLGHPDQPNKCWHFQENLFFPVTAWENRGGCWKFPKESGGPHQCDQRAFEKLSVKLLRSLQRRTNDHFWLRWFCKCFSLLKVLECTVCCTCLPCSS